MDYRIKTPCGELQGCAGRIPGVAAYKGIRYASAGRWEYPVLVKGWHGIYDATRYRSCCYQPRAFADEGKDAEKAFYYNEFRKGERYTYSEDCLFLNVFTPDGVKETDRLPVLVYIHGGGFVGGCGHEKHFDCPVWPVKGVIGVTLNYRLGPLGFAALPELKQEAGFTGNYGLFDQLAALRWVRENIAAFGGDPEKITLMGQSAGGMSVQLHCESPLSDGLISGAVISSGTLDKLFPTPMPEKYYDFWHAVMADCGCDTLEAFRNAPVERLFAAWKERSKEQKGGGCFPCMDGRLVPETPAGTRKKPVPCMVGSTSEDVVPALLHRACKDWARTQEKKSYAWYFDRRLPGDGKGAWHSSDLWYWFGTLPNCWRPMTEKDYDLSRQMTDYLANFCKYGDPNGGGLAAWLPMVKGQRKILCLGEGQTRMGRPDVTRLVKNTLTSKAKGE